MNKGLKQSFESIIYNITRKKVDINESQYNEINEILRKKDKQVLISYCKSLTAF